MPDSKRTVEIYDTTLRDGTQREGISLSVEDKIRIAQQLDDIGVTYIEGGWPGSNPKDVEFFERAQDMEWKNVQVAAFGSTCRKHSDPAEDVNIQALVDSEAPVCTIFGKTWTLHVKEALRTTLDENLRMIEESVSYLKAQGRKVLYDAEHFFDGYKADPQYALKTINAAISGGAEIIVLCDTNGGSMPWEIDEICREVKASIGGHPFGIHAHNDGECGVANTLAAVRAGAMHIQGTINGYGERCGNANLCSIIPDLELKMDIQALPEGHLPQLYDLSHFVAEVANLQPDEHAPYVGRSAFAHKGGIHVAAVRRNADSYQHVEPELVGNEMRVVVSELSGRSNLFSKADEYGLELEQGDAVAVLNEIKELESKGFSFEAAEASVAMLVRRQAADYREPFMVLDYTTLVEQREGRGLICEASVKLEVDGRVIHTISEGNGPVNALDGALRKALVPIYPHLIEVQLSDFKVRILDSQSATAATTRVLIDTTFGSEFWSTVGASPNIIEASWKALIDSIEYSMLLVNEEIPPESFRVMGK